MKTRMNVLVGVKLPEDLLKALDSVVCDEDSDRSKFIRNAVRERIARITGRHIRRPKPSTGTTSHSPSANVPSSPQASKTSAQSKK
ncbi:MAG: ribbon-helix-helix domain-containing protein [Puniceicoccales bacterium]|nr:ribbon-helix-helix domain-containing protein [Puniceicoccales bacterium]